MDADVLCDARMLARLGDGQVENTLLVDRELEPGDEPVKLCFRRGSDGRDEMVDFRKQPEHAHDWHGESVGFFLHLRPHGRRPGGAVRHLCLGGTAGRGV